MSDVVVIGAGIAGLAAAAQLGPDASVRVLEMEQTPAHHATGRSAALYIPTYGPAQVQALTRASRPWFTSNAEGRSSTDLLTSRDVMYVSDQQHLAELHELVDMTTRNGGVLDVIDADDCWQRCPALRPGWVSAGAVDRDAHDMDVAAIVDVFRRMLVDGGGSIDLDHRVTAITARRGGWDVATTQGVLRTDVIVNAAGAWVDHVAGMAGVAPLGFVPKRRTLAVSVPTPGADPGTGFVADAGETFYFGREAGGVLFSPSDANPSEPRDARPEEIDVARAIDAVNVATTLGLRSVRSSWAGLRTFSPDGGLVIGADPSSAGFVWCAGQGGYGIQTSYAAGAAAAALALGRPLPDALVAAGLTAEHLTPDRFG